MTSTFINTSGWACLFDARQPSNQAAIDHFKTLRNSRSRIITSNYVIAELIALFDSPLRLPRSTIFTTIDTIKTNPYVEIIHITPEIDTAAWNLCKARSDKPWSLVDCTSFVLMKQNNIQMALTTDDLRSVFDYCHFEQAGFIRLLKS